MRSPSFLALPHNHFLPQPSNPQIPKHRYAPVAKRQGDYTTYTSGFQSYGFENAADHLFQLIPDDFLSALDVAGGDELRSYCRLCGILFRFPFENDDELYGDDDYDGKKSVRTNGEAATWNEGNNTVAVTVTKSGSATGTYTITVVKAAG